MLVGFIPTLTVTIPAKVSLKWLAPENAHVILTVYVYSITGYHGNRRQVFSSLSFETPP